MNKGMSIDTMVRLMGNKPNTIIKVGNAALVSLQNATIELENCQKANKLKDFSAISHRIKSVIQTVGATELLRLLNENILLGQGYDLHARGTGSMKEILIEIVIVISFLKIELEEYKNLVEKN